ncbi:MAG: c-type cytochrome, partial [Gemmatimonadota bacterium]
MANKFVRGLGILIGVVLAIVVAIVGLIYFVSWRQLSKSYDVTPASLVVPSDSAAIARGRHLSIARLGCSDCHAADLGGQVAIDAMPFGRFVPTNLTPGGVGGTYTDADWVRAIRNGVRPNGSPLVFMPSHSLSHLGAEDLGAVIAYVKSVPAVTRDLPPSSVGPIGRMLMATGKVPLIAARVIDQKAPIPQAPPEGVTAEYGGYLVATGGCRDCHGPSLSGGKIAGGPDDPPAKNITPTGIGQWSEADFLRALRQGTRPDGTPINQFMPWKSMGKMTDDELRAIFS